MSTRRTRGQKGGEKEEVKILQAKGHAAKEMQSENGVKGEEE